jgi:hypothetical protein
VHNFSKHLVFFLLGTSLFVFAGKSWAKSLDIRDATIYLERQHNTSKSLNFKMHLGLGSQIPFQDLAVDVDVTNANSSFFMETRGAWFYELKLGLRLFHPLEIYGLGHYGLFQVESIINAAVDRTHTLDISQIGFGGGLKINMLKGDLVPYLTGFGGLSPTTYTLQQNFSPFIEESVTTTTIFYGGGLGMDIYISQHFGTNLQASVYFYPTTPEFADFTSTAFTHKPLFLDALTHMMIHTSLFYEF